MAIEHVHREFIGKKILISGAAGFIGGHLAEELSRISCSLVLTDCVPCVIGQSSCNDKKKADVSFYKTNTKDPEFIELVSDGCWDFIFHLAGNANVGASVENPEMDIQNNLYSTLSLLEAMRRVHSHANLIYASSAAVYGNPTSLPVKESDPTNPISPYGASKLAAEKYLAVYCELYGVRGLSVRMFSPFGPRLKKQIIYELAKKVIENPVILSVIGDGTQTRDFIYIDDLVSALLHVAIRAEYRGEAYNIGSGREYRTSFIAEKIIRYFGYNTEIQYTRQDHRGYPQRWCADVEKIKALGWGPSVDVEYGLERTLEWILHEHSQH